MDNPAKTILNIQAGHARDAVPTDNVTADKQKGSAKLLSDKSQIQKRLAEEKQMFSQAKESIETLRSERAEISLKDGKDKELAELDRRIGLVNAELLNAPAVISLLETQLAEAEAKIAAESRDATLDAQKAAGKKCLELSTKLVGLLEQAVGINAVLVNTLNSYQALYKRTNIDTLGSHFAEPSRGMLDFLFQHLRGELKDGRHVRLTTPTGPQV